MFGKGRGERGHFPCENPLWRRYVYSFDWRNRQTICEMLVRASSPMTALKGLIIYTANFSKFGNGHPAVYGINNGIVSSIPLLNLLSHPTAILFAIVSVRIDSVEGESLRIGLTHIFPKLIKRRPLFTNLNTPTAIRCISVVTFAFAPVTHCLPHGIRL